MGTSSGDGTRLPGDRIEIRDLLAISGDLRGAGGV
jgi:hypothetical protein